MKKKIKKLLLGLLCLFAVTETFAQVPDHLTAITPKEIDSVLYNPGIGFTTFQRFNGDPDNVLEDCCGDFRDDFPLPVSMDEQGELKNPYYPNTTIAYFRFYWIYIEPEEGKFRWDIIDRALATARERNQTLMFSVMPYGTGGVHDVPKWYRKMVGKKTEWKHNNEVNKWLVDAEDPRYIKYYGRLVKELGERYDGHPDLESIDARIVGAWGEGGGTDVLTKKTAKALMDPYLDSFQKTPIKLLLTDSFASRYSASKANVGYRADCLGDLGFWADAQGGWTHMFDYYPRAIIKAGLKDAWKEAPVSFEICGLFPTWKKAQGYTAMEVEYIFDQALKWHGSSVNGKSSAIPVEYQPQVEEFLKKLGYRFVLKRITYPTEIRHNQKLELRTWWENKGVAPIYKDYKLAIRIQNENFSKSFTTNADITEWLPGDNIFNQGFFMPVEMPEGKYELHVGVIDERSKEPKVNLAIEGKTKDGWYNVGKIVVKN